MSKPLDLLKVDVFIPARPIDICEGKGRYGVRWVGVDPGKSGAIVALVEDGSPYAAIKLDRTERDVYDWLHAVTRGSPFATLERVHSMPGQGVASTFKFGASYGSVRMALIAASVPFEEVTPAKWQRALSCLTGGNKNVTKAKAQELWPHVKITHAIADALLLAEYGRRLHR